MEDNGKFLMGLVAGIGLGTVLGVLIAPEKGTDTYKKLEKAVKKATKDLKAYSDEKFKLADKTVKKTTK